MLIVEATLQRHAPNVHVREVFICHKGPRTIAITIVSGGEVLAVLAVLIKNVLGSSLTRATLIVVATEQRRVPNVPAIKMVLIWVSTWPRMVQQGLSVEERCLPSSPSS